MKVNNVSTKKVNDGDKMPPSWELAIADAEERISQLRRSIEMFKHHIRTAMPFPGKSATHN
jgi:hypothetical protein